MVLQTLLELLTGADAPVSSIQAIKYRIFSASDQPGLSPQPKWKIARCPETRPEKGC